MFADSEGLIVACFKILYCLDALQFVHQLFVFKHAHKIVQLNQIEFRAMVNQLRINQNHD